MKSHTSYGCGNACKVCCVTTIVKHVVARALTVSKTIVASAVFSDTSVLCMQRYERN